MNDVVMNKQDVALGQLFLESLGAQDFERLEALFAPQVRFRALVPSGLREARTARDAAGWLRHWFGEADVLRVLQSTAGLALDRLYLSYRLQLHEPVDGWSVIEQHAYCSVQEGRIADMWLLCSGFRPDPEMQAPVRQSPFEATAFYDAGSKGCTDGPLDDIAGLLHRMSSGQTLEVHASSPSVAEDLPAWCRMSGQELMAHEGEFFLIRRK
jgi:TusA-related sulfurtransferase